jgi:hypothetical protein
MPNNSHQVTSNQIRCYELSPGTGAQGTYEVAAGSTLGFTAQSSVSHPGPLQFYMAKVPEGKTAASWDGSGNVWFKIFEQGPNISGGQLSWPSAGKYFSLRLLSGDTYMQSVNFLMSMVLTVVIGATKVTVPIPKSLPSGEYLFRVEHIALHSAGSTGGAQFYISCAQIKVTGGGSGSPTGLVAFPGAYKASDPGILINIYYPVPTSYTPPGPRPWTG